MDRTRSLRRSMTTHTWWTFLIRWVFPNHLMWRTYQYHSSEEPLYPDLQPNSRSSSSQEEEIDAGRHMDAEDIEDDVLQDMGDEAERLEEEFLRQRERRKAKKPK